MRYHDSLLEQPKSSFGGAQRARDAADTLGLIEPFFDRAGITRLADITHLDRVGIPVVLAIRPAGLYLGADAGKGRDLTAAKVSAAMEGFERWRAETGTFETLRCTYEELQRRYVSIPESRFSLTREGVIARGWAYRWTACWDLMNEQEVAVPTLRVELPSEDRMQRDLGTFVWGSTGLASGNSFIEAIHSALLEAIERDAVTCTQWASRHAGYVAPRLDLATIDDPVACEYRDRLQSAGLNLEVADCTIDTGVPAYLAMLLDTREPGVGAFAGQGAHTDPGVALSRALAEAAQSRLVFIAGSRDDIFKRDHLRARRNGQSLLRTVFDREHRYVDFSDAPRLSTATFEGDLESLIHRLNGVGIEQVLVADLSDPELPVAIARVVVPGLEEYLNHLYRPGERAIAFAGRVGK